MGQLFKGEGPPLTPIKDGSYIKELKTRLLPAHWDTHRGSKSVWRKGEKKYIYKRSPEKHLGVTVWPPSRGDRSTGKEEEEEGERKSQRGKRGNEASQRGTGSFSSTRTLQTCLTLPAPGRWRGVRILMNFSKPWVSPLLSLFLPLLSPLSLSLPLHPCMRLTIHHVHIEKGFSCSLRMLYPTSNNMALFGEAPWEKKAGIYGEMLLKGNPSALREIWNTGCWIPAQTDVVLLHEERRGAQHYSC